MSDDWRTGDPIPVAPRSSDSTPFRVTVVCLGNICRSPIGEAVIRDRVAAAGLDARVQVDSAGTGDWHLGHDADHRARQVLRDHGYALTHRARQIVPSWLESIDLLLAMDATNYANLQAMGAGSTGGPMLRMLRSFDPSLRDLPEGAPGLEVPDPYYSDSDGFTQVLRMIEVASDGLVVELPRLMARGK